MTRINPRLVLGTCALVVILLCVSATAIHCCVGSQYITNTSPVGRFRVVVYRRNQWFGMGPGQSSDAPGVIRLYDTVDGRVLKQSSVEMVQLVEDVLWSKTNVYVKFVADWELPQLQK